MKIKCLIVDDEPIALQLIEKYVEKTPFLELVGKCSSAFSVIDYIEKDPQISLLFLDIQMPELSGLELSRTLPKNIRIIFTTAFESYAIEGYKVNALGYLLKPFDYAEFLAAVYKAKDWFEQLGANEVVEKTSYSEDFIFIKSEYKQIKIPFNDILYIEGLKDYAKIFLSGQDKPILTLNTLKKLESELPSEQFMRVHRSYIIALNKIDEIERSQIIINKQRITIANQYKEEFDLFLVRNSL